MAGANAAKTSWPANDVGAAREKTARASAAISEFLCLVSTVRRAGVDLRDVSAAVFRGAEQGERPGLAREQGVDRLGPDGGN